MTDSIKKLDQVIEQIKAMGQDPKDVLNTPTQNTHWEGCWREHHRCAIAEIEYLQDILNTLKTLLHNSGYSMLAEEMREKIK